MIFENLSERNKNKRKQKQNSPPDKWYLLRHYKSTHNTDGRLKDPSREGEEQSSVFVYPFRTSLEILVSVVRLCACMYVYVCVYIYVCVCIYMFVYMYMCACICVYMYVHIYVCMCVCICVYTYTCVFVCMYMHVCICVCMYMHVYICVYVCVCVHVYVCMCVPLSPGLQSFLFHLFAFIFSSFLWLVFLFWGHHSWPTALWPELSLLHQEIPEQPQHRRGRRSIYIGNVQLTWTDRMGGRPTFQGRRPKSMAATLSHTAYPRASNGSTGTHHAARRLSGDWYLRGELRLWSQTSLGLYQHLPPATCVLVGNSLAFSEFPFPVLCCGWSCLPHRAANDNQTYDVCRNLQSAHLMKSTHSWWRQICLMISCVSFFTHLDSKL